MQLALKNIKIHAGLSEETTCYEAVLYVDGKRACHVSNRGTGGCDDQHWLPGSPRQAVEDHFKAMPAYDEALSDGTRFTVQPDLESWCADALTEHAVLADYARATKRAVVVVHGDKEYTFKAKPPVTAALRAHVAAKYPGSTIINDLDPEALRAHVRKALDEARDRRPAASAAP